MKSTETWLIEPRDALIVRDGRPFGATTGNRAESLAFPFPATLTGAARTRAGLSVIGGELSRFAAHKIGGQSLADVVLAEIAVSGALLAEISTDDAGKEAVNLLPPAPADAVLFAVKDPADAAKTDETRAQIVPLLPLPIKQEIGVASNLNSATDGAALRLLGLQRNLKAKPHKQAPQFWRWATFANWLKNPQPHDGQALACIGVNPLEKDRRTHVAMDYAVKTGRDGELFQTRGLELARRHIATPIADDPEKAGISFTRYGLVLRVDKGNFSGAIRPGVAPLGGERRLVGWRKSPTDFPPMDAALKQQIIEQKRCRLILLTPALFRAGFVPQLPTPNGLRITLEAAAVNRYQVVSGWDFKQGNPKPTRRLCPAGAVFFLKLDGDAQQIGQWLDATWFNCISDNDSDRRDGFGLAVWGAWDKESLDLAEALRDEED